MKGLDNLRKLAASVDPALMRRGGRARPRSIRIVMLGAGAIGGSVGAWVARHHDNIFFHDLPEVNARLKRDGLTVYPQGRREAAETVPVRVIDDLREAADAEAIVIGVKNYSLDRVARMVREQVGDRPLVVGMQNGLANQQILPRHFPKVAYCVISYNAWIDPDGAIGFQKQGPLHLGTRENELRGEVADLARVLNLGVETHVTDTIGDAAHCKLVINLTNSLTTLIGHGFRPISDEALFQRLLTNLLYEGVRVVRAAGVRESRLGGMPPWVMVKAGARLPRLLTRKMFARNVRKMVVSSMAQDVIARRGAENELESINGYLLELARRHGIRTPYNDAVIELCRREFAKADFIPLDVRDVWQEVEPRL